MSNSCIQIVMECPKLGENILPVLESIGNSIPGIQWFNPSQGMITGWITGADTLNRNHSEIVSLVSEAISNKQRIFAEVF